VTLYSATLSATGDSIQVRVPAQSRTHERLAAVPGAWFDTTVLRWYIPLTSAQALFSAVSVLIISQTLRKRLEERG
jgi:hypothetical protein